MHHVSIRAQSFHLIVVAVFEAWDVHGAVHRDLHTRNVLLEWSEEALHPTAHLIDLETVCRAGITQRYACATRVTGQQRHSRTPGVIAARRRQALAIYGSSSRAGM